jgi:hypothetical protein
MYDSKLVQMDSESSRIEDVWQQVKPLSTDEKAELVKRLLGQGIGSSFGVYKHSSGRLYHCTDEPFVLGRLGLRTKSDRGSNCL